MQCREEAVAVGVEVDESWIAVRIESPAMRAALGTRSVRPTYTSF